MASTMVPEMTPPAGAEASSDARTAAGAATAGVFDSEQTPKNSTIGAKINDGRILFDTHISVCILRFSDHHDPKSEIVDDVMVGKTRPHGSTVVNASAFRDRGIEDDRSR
jgi:hypothetical protein